MSLISLLQNHTRVYGGALYIEDKVLVPTLSVGGDVLVVGNQFNAKKQLSIKEGKQAVYVAIKDGVPDNLPAYKIQVFVAERDAEFTDENTDGTKRTVSIAKGSTKLFAVAP